MQSIVVPLHEPVGTQEGVGIKFARLAAPPPVNTLARLARSRPGVQHVIPVPHSGLPAVMLQGTDGGPLSVTVEVLESTPASAGALFDDELHATASVTPTTVPTPILKCLMT